MTYIKWKDEVEGYLVTLPAEEKQRIFSYFSEMYADKRDAGKSEAQIIEEFGAPYDVAKRILDGSRDGAAADGTGAGAGASKVNGGNNYNYNYYNYNYGGAPQQPQPAKTAEQAKIPPDPPPLPNGIPVEYVTAKTPAKKDAGHVAGYVILAILLSVLSVLLTGSCLAVIIQGFITVGMAMGMLASGSGTAAVALINAGYGLLYAGGGLIFLAPFSLLLKTLWNKLKKIK